MTLAMNGKNLNNCMLDTSVGANMMSLKVMRQVGLKVTRPYRNVCGFEYKAIPTHGVVENVEVCLKEYPEKIVHIDIVVVDVPDVWGMLLSRKFVAMLGGTLEMDLTFLQFPLKNGTIGRLLNMPITRDHVQDITHPVNNDKAQNEMIQTLQKYSPEDMPFATEEDFDQIKWPKKEEYQQLLDEFKNKEIGTVKILKKHEDDVQIHPSQ
jgi:DNA-binding cell septation regulator SpoVG